MANETKEQRDKLLQLVKDAAGQDNELREKHGIGEKFRFIRDRLSALLSHVNENLTEIQSATEKKETQINEDEVLAYVYLFNAHGLVLQTWNRMVSASVLYEYSVNRPIYMDKTHVEANIRGKQNKAQHGFISIVIKKADILPVPAGAEPAKDVIGNPVYKVKEGSLRFNSLVSFTHQEHEYILNAQGELVRKPQD